MISPVRAAVNGGLLMISLPSGEVIQTGVGDCNSVANYSTPPQPHPQFSGLLMDC